MSISKCFSSYSWWFHGGMCSSFKFSIGFCCVYFLFLGASAAGIDSGFLRPTRKWIISGRLRCVIVSLGCLETVHSRLKNLFVGRGCYHLFFNCHFFFSPCSLEDLPCTHFINFPYLWYVFVHTIPVSTMTIHGLLTVLWFLANYSWDMNPSISWHKKLLSVSCSFWIREREKGYSLPWFEDPLWQPEHVALLLYFISPFSSLGLKSKIPQDSMLCAARVRKVLAENSFSYSWTVNTLCHCHGEGAWF